MGETASTEDLLRAAQLCHRTLEPHLDADWSVAAGDLEWDCRETLDHIVTDLWFYAAHLATLAPDHLPFIRDGAPTATLEQLLRLVVTSATVLSRIVEAAPAGARAYHPYGMADPSGFIAMACDEILAHTFDICAGLGVPFEPPADLPAKVVARLFPWTPESEDPWRAFLWCNGRTALEGHERLGSDWGWQCAPLEEWNGERVLDPDP